MGDEYYVRFGGSAEYWAIEVRGRPTDECTYSVDESRAYRYSRLSQAQKRAREVGGEVVRRVKKSDYRYEVVHD